MADKTKKSLAEYRDINVLAVEGILEKELTEFHRAYNGSMVELAIYLIKNGFNLLL